MEQRFLRETKYIEDTEVLSLINLFFPVSHMSLIPSLSKRQAVPSTEHLEVLYSNFLYYLLIHIHQYPHTIHPPFPCCLIPSLIVSWRLYLTPFQLVMPGISCPEGKFTFVRTSLTHLLTHKHTHKRECESKIRREKADQGAGSHIIIKKQIWLRSLEIRDSLISHSVAPSFQFCSCF